MDIVAKSAGNQTVPSNQLEAVSGKATAAAASVFVEGANPTFTMSASPTVIRNLVGRSTIKYSIKNNDTAPLTGVSFTDDFPAGINLDVAPITFSNDCIRSGPEGYGPGFGITNHGVVGSGTCEISVIVRATSTGQKNFETNTLTPDFGDGGKATTSIEVNQPPTFSMAVSPSVIAPGGTTTATYTINHQIGEKTAEDLFFDHVLPSGVQVASPSNISSTCDVPQTTTSSNIVQMTDGAIKTGRSCTVTVDLVGSTEGTYNLETTDLSTSEGTAAKASTVLTVAQALEFEAAFSPAAFLVGQTTRLTITINNQGTTAATAAKFAGNWSDWLAVPASPNLAVSGCGASPSTMFSVGSGGNNEVEFSGGEIAPGATCTIAFDLLEASPTPGTGYGGAFTPGTLTSSAGTSVGVAAPYSIDNLTALLNAASISSDNADPTIAELGDEITLTLQFSDPMDPNMTVLIGGVPAMTQAGATPNEVLAKVTVDNSFANGAVSFSATDIKKVSGFPVADVSATTDGSAVTVRIGPSAEETQAMITEFMANRAANITTNAPDFIPHVNGGGVGVTMNASAVEGSQVIDLSVSRSALLAFNGDSIGDNSWDVWAKVKGSKSESGTASSDFWLGQFGVHKFLNHSTIIGVMAQVDHSEEVDSVVGSSADGTGWMVGPYVAGRFGDQNLFYQAMLTWGKSKNDISPDGTYTDQFDTTRMMASAKLQGSFAMGEVTVSPALALSYFTETQEAYVDSNSVAIPETTISFGELSFGPTFSRVITRGDGSTITPRLGVTGVMNFDVSDNLAAQGHVLGTDQFRARLTAGLGIDMASGSRLTFEGYYDGIGAAGYEAYGLSVELSVPF